MDYRETLNLPKTTFKMKANLTQKEPMYLKRWDREDLYHKLQEAASGRPLFVLHDGPPYANGHIHLGTAFNKVLKDIILKSRRMAGFKAPYVPGWDCHGLPIEHNVDQELGEKKEKISVLGKRGACRKYAEKWVKTQKAEFKRLGVLGDWEDPYLTMKFAYEAVIAREFNKFLLSGSVVRAKKPVYWCTTCGTSLAEAEVEYHDHASPSIYVKFPVADDLADVAPELAGRRVLVLIWTTTPWTLPANMAVAFHPDFVYAAVEVGSEVWILAAELVESCLQTFGISDYKVLATFSARALEGRKCRHPFMERDSLMVLADYVTAESGTGCVHTAPGHGADDYQTGLRYGLEILSPVDAAGKYTAEAGRYEGCRVPEVNREINDDLRAAGFLVHEEAIDHSYPHCWRCKKPVIYRATEQWFISMQENGLRDKALAAIKEVSWTPAWGRQRISGMVAARPDWCLSRQRSWGVPLTVLTCARCGGILKDRAVCRRIEELFEKEGADAWFRYEPAQFVPPGTTCSACGSTEFNKEGDILDVWFDSGVSHAAVCEARPELESPADLYLEGSDQHRGWFQSSLLTSVGTRGRAPFKGVLTHGYVVDGQGKKMSKSVGNVVAPKEVIDKYGAEILRLWVASEDYRDDVKVSDEILRHVADAYRKMRNTIRFMLSNLYDFDPAADSVAIESMDELDRWALGRFAELTRTVVKAYMDYEFHAVYHALHNFCGTAMSSLYLDVLKDRLYVSLPDAPGRRAAQTVIYRILDGLLRLITPILSFTAAEAWEHLQGQGPDEPVEQSVFFARFPAVDDLQTTESFAARWDRLLAIRGEITKVLEAARRSKVIGLSLDAEVLVQAGGETAEFLADKWELLREICIVSSLREEADLAGIAGLDVVEAEEVSELRIAVRPAPGEKCERCWTIADTVGRDDAHPALCRRCAEVVRVLGG
ncbi:isoleucine--tRNA ligase [bacterium BMS3Bbin14]|nr:isoleucine--tRNA ligase [bacterium BMS3Abin13]GBE53151.1 isoleucine--tRNA ligase [bacterium BMS3Bbin14]